MQRLQPLGIKDLSQEKHNLEKRRKKKEERGFRLDVLDDPRLFHEFAGLFRRYRHEAF
jgi:hypothetical protein